MMKALFPLIFAIAAASRQYDPAANQLPKFRDMTKSPIGILTTETGVPVDYREATSSLNTEFLDNDHLIDSYSVMLRKSIPERVVHANGVGAYGHIEITHDISHLCKAKLFSRIGKKTPLAMRFSTGFSSIGVRDTIRDSRGYGIKFYTEEGNFDLTMLFLPVFAFKDPLLFPSLTKVLKKNPVTHLPDHNMIWDYLTLHPEGLNQFLRLLSHMGMPRSWTKMQGFSVHTFQVYNHTGHSHFMRFHCSPVGGPQFMFSAEANELGAKDDFPFARDLYNSIESGNYPKWQLSVQIVPEHEAMNPELGIFDVTRELPFSKYPPHPVGIITLNRHCLNQYAEMEHIAFSPSGVVPGILGSPDGIFRIRRYAYRDTQNYRLGPNHKRIPVNSPLNVTVLTYNRDGPPPLALNGGNGPNYYPNRYNGAIPCEDKFRPTFIKIREIAEPRNFEQVKAFYISLKPVEQNELVKNVVEHMSPCEKSLQERAVQIITRIHSEFGKRIAKGLGLNC